MTNLEAFTLRLRAVAAALAPTVGQACAEECARSIAGILRDGEEDVERAIEAVIGHRVTHCDVCGRTWALGDARWMALTATEAWLSVSAGARREA